MRIHKTLRDHSQGFTRTFAEDFARFWKRFARICDNLGEDLQGFVRLWQRIRKGLQNFEIAFTRILRDFGRGFTRICKTLGKDLQ